MSTIPTNARWFQDLGSCSAGCGRSAVGALMNHRNERLGVYCRKCADAALKLSDRKAAQERKKGAAP